MEEVRRVGRSNCSFMLPWRQGFTIQLSNREGLLFEGFGDGPL